MTLNKIEKSMKDTKESIIRQMEMLEMEARANRLIGDIPEIDDVSYISCFEHGDVLHITFSLDSDKRDSKLIHKLSQK